MPHSAPKIDFYVIKQPSEADLRFFACRLVEKIFRQGLQVYIQTQSLEAAQVMDDLLWSFRPESFLPHTIINSEDCDDVPVIIGYGASCNYPRAVLINLASEIPEFHSEFQRIVEIVRNDESSKQLSREHWSFYKSKNYALNKTDV